MYFSWVNYVLIDKMHQYRFLKESPALIYVNLMALKG